MRIFQMPSHTLPRLNCHAKFLILHPINLISPFHILYHTVKWVLQTSLCVDGTFFNKCSDLTAQGIERKGGLISTSAAWHYPCPCLLIHGGKYPYLFFMMGVRQVILVFTWLFIAFILYKPQWKWHYNSLYQHKQNCAIYFLS